MYRFKLYSITPNIYICITIININTLYAKVALFNYSKVSGWKAIAIDLAVNLRVLRV